ncbi:MAG: hypothetical protein H6983_03105 [Ectothiorhodospiraceae bacterium]|nr:hypothetical protein [Ectothiorhodospiraceae bacterium]
MTRLEVLDPTGATEVTRLHAPRAASLAGKTVAMLSVDMWQSHRMLPMVREHLAARHPGIRLIEEDALPKGLALIDREETADAIVGLGVDAVVIGNAA